ncbi:MAG: hypothetical protein M3Q07_28640 [Pseudobdellovibrionaceae bacterium]|nr:hypothetical protein [Pseudobdellovibrionaceae bacterium]
MNATMSIPLVKKHKPVSGSAHCESPCCTRCRGLLVEERCMDIGESLGGYWFLAMRCVQCGDIVDEVILRNRYAHLEAQEVVRAA